MPRSFSPSFLIQLRSVVLAMKILPRGTDKKDDDVKAACRQRSRAGSTYQADAAPVTERIGPVASSSFLLKTFVTIRWTRAQKTAKAWGAPSTTALTKAIHWIVRMEKIGEPGRPNDFFIVMKIAAKSK